MKQLFKQIAAIVLAACLLGGMVCAVAAEGLSNFEETTRVYTPGQFPDVALAGWYTPYVAAVYELGLMQGNSVGAFCPGGNVTYAETLTIAARMHKIYYTGDGAFTQSEPWYQVYVDYARENGISAAAFDNFDAPARRSEFAAILAHALPASALSEMNAVADGTIPDVPASAENAAEIYLLYRAGILTGNDAAGTFAPDSEIRRSEVAAIAARMARPALRCSFVPKVYPDLQTRTRAEDGFFSDAAMLGNSLVDGMMLCSGLPMAYYGGTSRTVFNNRLNELLQKQYGKVYIEFGINELGGSVDSFITSYRGIIERIRATMPEAEIYIMAITPVTKAKSDQGVFTMKRIGEFNDALYLLAKETDCWYLDTCGGLCDATGYLPAQYAGWDASPHLEVAGYKAWAEVIRTHYAD